MTEKKERAVDKGWEAIFKKYHLYDHNFGQAPYEITAQQIKVACQHFKSTGEKEVRILCKQDSRDKRPSVFISKGLFLLPVRNGLYRIIQGEGYADIPAIESPPQRYESSFPFDLQTSKVKGKNSEMQHLDYAYAMSLIRSFVGDESLVLTIRGRKYTPQFSFRVGQFNIEAESVQTEVDSGYEGKDKVVLVEAKNSKTTNVIIRQLYYPYRQWSHYTSKEVLTVFFEKRGNLYLLWQFGFRDKKDYNSLYLQKSCCYQLEE